MQKHIVHTLRQIIVGRGQRAGDYPETDYLYDSLCNSFH